MKKYLIAFILIISIFSVSAIKWNVPYSAQSDCTCISSNSSNNIYNFYNDFDQSLNTTDYVYFGDVTISFEGIDTIYLGESIHGGEPYGLISVYDNDYNEFFSVDSYSQFVFVAGSFETNDLYSYNSLAAGSLAGSGNAYACVNSDGTLYRSSSACV